MEGSSIEWGRPPSADGDANGSAADSSHTARPQLRVSRVLRADEIGDLKDETPPRPTRAAPPPPPTAHGAFETAPDQPQTPQQGQGQDQDQDLDSNGSDEVDGGGLHVTMNGTPNQSVKRRASVIRLGANIDGMSESVPLNDLNLDSPPGSGIKPPPVAATDRRSVPRRASVIRLGSTKRPSLGADDPSQPLPLMDPHQGEDEVEWEDMSARLKAVALAGMEAEAEAEAEVEAEAEAEAEAEDYASPDDVARPPPKPRRASVIRLGKTLDGTNEMSKGLTVETATAAGRAAGAAKVRAPHGRVGPVARVGAAEVDAPSLVRASSVDGEWDGDEYYTPRVQTIGSNVSDQTDDAGIASHGHAHARPGGVDGAWHGDQHKAYRDVPRRFSVIRLGKTIDGQPDRESNRTTHYGLNGGSNGDVRTRPGGDHRTHAHTPVDLNGHGHGHAHGHAQAPVDLNGSWSSANGAVNGINGANGSEAQPHVAHYRWDGTEQPQVGSDGVDLGGSGSFSIDGDWNGHHHDEYYRPREPRRTKSVIRLGQSFDGTPDNVSMDGSIDLDPHSPRYASNDIDAGVNAYHSYSNAWDGHRSWEL